MLNRFSLMDAVMFEDSATMFFSAAGGYQNFSGREYLNSIVFLYIEINL